MKFHNISDSEFAEKLMESLDYERSFYADRGFRTL